MQDSMHERSNTNMLQREEKVWAVKLVCVLECFYGGDTPIFVYICMKAIS